MRLASTSEVFLVILTDADSIVNSITSISNSDGTYSVVYQFTKASTYTLQVTDSTGTNQIASSPYTGIAVSPGTAQALKSAFESPSNPINAGSQVTYQVKARDYFSDIVANDSTDPYFFLSVLSPTSNAISIYPMTF